MKRRLDTRIFSLLKTRKWTTLAAGGLALAGLGSLLFGGGDEGFERWPIPEEFTRDGSGRLADLIPGDWEVICYTGPYRRLPVDIPRDLARAGLPSEYAEHLPDPYFPEHQYAFVLLGSNYTPRILLIQVKRFPDFEYIIGGNCLCQQHNEATYSVRTSTDIGRRFSSITMNSLVGTGEK